ncbi:FAD-dependent thiol oxidase [Dendrothele bispora CBS 962.96]|uniref:Sulfhydryl oxidase n=1 Tax=Dendrothele bispora (strain CBS 962.96) TaxID=1314807 RepID=A0A4S8LC19_DENBC|nr:FAD-dependent thiol oxidase [Dendrothele bispora CBS 962.96]
MPDSSSSSSETPSKPKSSLPPGMVMGPDGKPCKVCTAFRNWPGKTTKSNAKSSTQKSTAVGAMAAIASGGAVASVSSPDPNVLPAHCPPDVEQLGRATWTFLHTTAAYYPERPTPTQRANMLSLIRALPLLYPCSHCADDFGEDMKNNAPDVSGRAGLSRWLCERHNEVNVKLGKEKFDCGKTDERWKDGPTDGSCD